MSTNPRADVGRTSQRIQQELAHLCVAAGGLTGDEVPKIDAAVARAAVVEGLAPLLGARLDSGTLRASAPEVREDLTRAYHGCLAWTLFANASIRDLVAGLRDAAIPVVALKGSALIRTVMRPGERPMVDIDLLVPASAWVEARRIATDGGASLFDPLDRPITAGHDYAFPMRTREGLFIELHRYLCERPLFRPRYDGPDGIFARAVPTDDGLPVPEQADLFLGLAIHAAHHAYHLPFRAVVDGLLLGASPGLVLSSVVTRARAWRARTATAAFLIVLRRFGFAHPDVGAALRELGPLTELEPMLADAPWPEREVHSEDWHRRWRVARLLDGTPARVAYFGHRLGLRVADTIWNRWARFSR